MSTAFVFPGQGSQAIGMLKDLAQSHKRVRETFDEASAVLGYDLWRVVQQGPETKLNATEVTQPAMLAAGVAVWRVWDDEGGPTPSVMAGHSLGEYSALVCAGALAFRDAVALVADRGRFMQQAVLEGSGAMAAILGLGDAQVADVCQRAAQDQVVSCANYNSPGQVVIAGHAEAVQRAVELAAHAGAKRAVLLPVSVPSHCALMLPAAEQLRERLKKLRLRRPAVPVIHNVDVATHEDPAGIAAALVEQLHRPVRWTDVVRRITDEGIETVLECGPGKVLTGLCKRIDKTLNCAAVYDPATLDSALSNEGI